MKKKNSYRLLWNTFLFIVCFGSIVFAWIEHHKVVKLRLQVEEFKAKTDSLMRVTEMLQMESERMQRSTEEALLKAKEEETQAQNSKK